MPKTKKPLEVFCFVNRWNIKVQHFDRRYFRGFFFCWSSLQWTGHLVWTLKWNQFCFPGKNFLIHMNILRCLAFEIIAYSPATTPKSSIVKLSLFFWVLKINFCTRSTGFNIVMKFFSKTHNRMSPQSFPESNFTPQSHSLVWFIHRRCAHTHISCMYSIRMYSDKCSPFYHLKQP